MKEKPGMKIALPEISKYSNPDQWIDGHQGGIGQPGYFIRCDQAEKILEALVAGESHARCFDDFRANPTAESCEEAIKIMTGERVENVTGEK